MVCLPQENSHSDSARRRGRELDRELRFHYDRQVHENLSRNMPHPEARDAAMRSLGRVAVIQEECRDMRRANHIENLLRDLRYAFRGMARNPGFTAVIVLTLTLAIGANSAIFSVIDGVLIAPLPYPQPGRLMRIFFSNATYPKFRLNPWDFHDFRDRNRSFEGIAAYARHDLQLSGNGDPELVPAIRSTAGYFSVLGIAPARGREFTPNDETQANSQVVILSDRLWRRRFSADPGIIGRTVMFDSLPYVVVGLMPPGVQHPGDDRNALPHGESVDAWTPFVFAGDPGSRGSHFLDGIGRLKKDVTPQQAAAELNLLIDQIVRAHPKYKTSGWRVIVHPLASLACYVPARRATRADPMSALRCD